MKKSLLLVAASALLSVQGFAQITIADTDFGTFVNTTDRMLKVSASTFITFPLTDHINQPRATGYTWNINALYGDTTNGAVFHRHVATTGYEYGDSMSDGFNTLYKYQTKELTNIAGTGIIRYGERVTRKAYSLGSLPMPNLLTDSLIILEQDALYYNPGFSATPAPRTILKLPVTLTTLPTPVTQWQNNYFYKVKAAFTYQFGGYQDDTLERRRYVVDNYSVIGHGSMRVRNHILPQQPWSVYENVLQIRAAFIQVKDSFFVNGVAATQGQLDTFNLIQGAQTMVYRDYFYRTGEVLPWVEVHYTDASRNVVQDAVSDRSVVHTNRTTTSVEELISENNYAVYPNPVKGGNVINIDIKESTANGKWEYSLINIMGQPVAQGSLNINSGKTSINVPKVAPGIYYIQASNGDQKIVKAMDIE